MDADEAERRKREQESAEVGQPAPSGGGPSIGEGTTTAPYGAGDIAPVPPMDGQPDPTRYFGSVDLNPQTLASLAREVSQEVINHLQSIYGAEVKLSLEIEVTVPDGIPEDRRPTVTENAAALRFDQSDFGED